MPELPFQINRGRVVIGAVLVASSFGVPLIGFGAAATVLIDLGTDSLASAFGREEKSGKQYDSWDAVLLDAWNTALDGVIVASLDDLHRERPSTKEKSQRETIQALFNRYKQTALHQVLAVGLTSGVDFDMIVDPDGQSHRDSFANAVREQSPYAHIDGHEGDRDYQVFEAFTRHLDDRFREQLHALAMKADPLGVAFNLYLDEVRYRYSQRRFDAIADAIGNPAQVLLARDVTAGLGGNGFDLVIADYDESKVFEFSYMTRARSQLREKRALFIRGRAASGKSALVKFLLQDYPYAFVVRPRKGSPPAGLERLSGHTIIMLVENIHEANARPDGLEAWWRDLRQVSPDRTYAIVTCRDGLDYARTRSDLESFIDDITERKRSIIDIKICDEEVINYCQAFGLDIDEVMGRWKGYIGSIQPGLCDELGSGEDRNFLLPRFSTDKNSGEAPAYSGRQDHRNGIEQTQIINWDVLGDGAQGRYMPLEDTIGMFMNSAMQALTSGKAQGLQLRKMTEYLLSSDAASISGLSVGDRHLIQAYGETVIGLSYEEGGAFPAAEGFFSLQEAETLADEVNDNHLSDFVQWSLGHYWRKRADVTRDRVDIRRARRILDRILAAQNSSVLVKSLAAIEITKITGVDDNVRIDHLAEAIRQEQDVVSAHRSGDADRWSRLLYGFHNAILREARLRLMAREQSDVGSILELSSTPIEATETSLSVNKNVGLPYTMAQAILRSPDATDDQRGLALEQIWNAQMFSHREGFHRQVWSGTQILTNKQFPLIIPAAYPGTCPQCWRQTTWVLVPEVHAYRCDRCKWMRTVQ